MINDQTTHERICKYNNDIEIFPTDNSKHGLVGLQNLGNTCFMNTALQCISNCSELTGYFLGNHYKTEINENNPIGSGGVLVRAYAGLLKNLWFGEHSSYGPWNFKAAIGAFQSMVNLFIMPSLLVISSMIHKSS
jgi:ubiquitin carboxyl-terminal hydrolase 4/11/15